MKEHILSPENFKHFPFVDPIKDQQRIRDENTHLRGLLARCLNHLKQHPREIYAFGRMRRCRWELERDIEEVLKKERAEG